MEDIPLYIFDNSKEKKNIPIDSVVAVMVSDDLIFGKVKMAVLNFVEEGTVIGGVKQTDER